MSFQRWRACGTRPLSQRCTVFGSTDAMLAIVSMSMCAAAMALRNRSLVIGTPRTKWDVWSL